MSVYIIAEAGVNHNGNLETAKLMVDKAKDSGVDCIKFQTFISKNLLSKTADKAEYQKKQTNSNENQYEMLKKLELSFKDFKELDKYCKHIGIEFLSTAFDDESIEFLNTLEMKRWKIPSGEITNLPYLIKIAKIGKPVILSTGMSTMNEIRDAVDVLNRYGLFDITILHCTTEYPTPFEDVNLLAMNNIKSQFNLNVGYSDHTKGVEVSLAAVAMGAIVIEKHFTLDRNMEGPDHRASLEPKELKYMVDSIRNVEIAIGSSEKKVTYSEKKNRDVARKSIVAKKYICKGELFTEDNLTVKRPGNGISPMKWFDILGKVAQREFKEDELIEL